MISREYFTIYLMILVITGQKQPKCVVNATQQLCHLLVPYVFCAAAVVYLCLAINLTATLHHVPAFKLVSDSSITDDTMNNR